MSDDRQETPPGEVPEWALRYDAGEYPLYAVTGDAVALARDADAVGATLRALVVVRGREPFAGLDAWPGGFLDWELDPTTRETALRELHEETGVEAELIGLLDVVDGVFPDIGRHYVLIDYLARWTAQ